MRRKVKGSNAKINTYFLRLHSPIIDEYPGENFEGEGTNKIVAIFSFEKISEKGEVIINPSPWHYGF